MTLIEVMQKLLEKERGKVICLEQLAFFASDKNVNKLLASIRHAAAVSCEGLHSWIMQRGGTTTNEVADLLDKVMDLPSWQAQFECLMQEEQEMVRMIEGLADENLSPDEIVFLRNQKSLHLENIQKYRALLG
ncbi:MAG: hypothetical protein AB1346_02335 [Thermodesulfobacteriota bacterium]